MSGEGNQGSTRSLCGAASKGCLALPFPLFLPCCSKSSECAISELAHSVVDKLGSKSNASVFGLSLRPRHAFEVGILVALEFRYFGAGEPSVNIKTFEISETTAFFKGASSSLVRSLGAHESRVMQQAVRTPKARTDGPQPWRLISRDSFNHWSVILKPTRIKWYSDQEFA